MPGYLIENALIFTSGEVPQLLRGQSVAVRGSRISGIGPKLDMQTAYPDLKRLDSRGRLLMPGLVNTHMHFYSTFSRGLSLPGPPRDFHDVLKLLWWRLDRSLDLEACYYSALLPAITAVKKGVTAVIDHHASANAVDGSLDQIEAAMRLVGLRGVLCYETSDRDGKDIARKGLQENERYLRRCRQDRQTNADTLYAGLFGLHASFTLDDDTLACAADICRSLDSGCHIHVAEDPVDARLTREKYGRGLAQRLHDAGLINPQSLFAHGIHLSEREKDLLGECDVMLAHTPQSNMNNAVGRTDIFGFLKRGMTVGLGTDGMSGDLKPDIRTAMWLHKHDLQDASAGWNEIQKMALSNNPEIYRRVSGQLLGRIEKGYLADLILVDYDTPTDIDGDNFWGHFLFGIVDAEVQLTMINGQIVMRDGEIPGIDAAEIAANARRVARGVWQRYYDH